MSRRSILVTGVSSGIGAATARHFIKLGWHVIGTVRSSRDAADLAALGGAAFDPVILDIVDERAVAQLPGKISRLLNGDVLDVLCNNAGTSVPAVSVCQSVEGFRAAVELNLIAPFAISRSLYPLLRKQGGKIIFVGSLAGVDPLPFCAAYSASKHGIEALASALRVELTMQGIAVSVVAPGSTRTAIGSKIGPDTPLEGMGSEFAPALATMAQHMGKQARNALEPELVAQAVAKAALSAKPKSRYVVTPGYVANWLAPRFLGRDWAESRWRRRLFR